MDSKEIVVEGAFAMEKDSKCSICLSPLHQSTKSSQCEKCSKTMSSIPTGYQNEIAGPDKKLFSNAQFACVSSKEQLNFDVNI